MRFAKILKNTTEIKKYKILISFGDMIADLLGNKKLNLIVTELFIKRRNLNISLVFITQFCISIPKNIRLNSTHFFIMKIPNKRELQQIAYNHLSNIFRNFMNRYKKCTAKPYSFLFIDTSLASDKQF